MTATTVAVAAPTDAGAGATTDMLAGARAMAPLIAAYVPFGLVVGAAVSTSADPLAAWLATWTIYGGAAHLAVLDVLSDGSGWGVAAVVGLLVNARLTAYAAAMAPQWRGTSLRLRAAAAVMLTDAPWALARGRSHGHRPFYFGAALTLFACWPVLVSVGVLLGDEVSAAPAAQLLPALTLGSLVVTQLGERPVAAAVAVAAVSAALTASLNTGAALSVAAATGVAAALWTQARS